MKAVLICLLVALIGFVMWALCRSVSMYDEYERQKEWEEFERYIDEHRKEANDAEEEDKS